MKNTVLEKQYGMILLENLHLAEEAISFDYGFDNNYATWESIYKVINEAGLGVDVVYAKLVDEKVITDQGWRTDLLYHGCVLVHVFSKEQLPGYKKTSPKIYNNTLLSPSGVTFLKAFMELHFP